MIPINRKFYSPLPQISDFFQATDQNSVKSCLQQKRQLIFKKMFRLLSKNNRHGKDTAFTAVMTSFDP